MIVSCTWCVEHDILKPLDLGLVFRTPKPWTFLDADHTLSRRNHVRVEKKRSRFSTPFLSAECT